MGDFTQPLCDYGHQKFAIPHGAAKK